VPKTIGAHVLFQHFSSLFPLYHQTLTIYAENILHLYFNMAINLKKCIINVFFVDIFLSTIIRKMLPILNRYLGESTLCPEKEKTAQLNLAVFLTVKTIIPLSFNF